MMPAALTGDPPPSTLPHATFITAWHEGSLRVEVDPAAAAALVSARLLLPFVAVAIIGFGIGLVLWGWLWTGLAVGAAGILGPRFIKRSEASFLLEHIADDPALYEAAVECGAVRYATPDLGPRSPDEASA